MKIKKSNVIFCFLICGIFLSINSFGQSSAKPAETVKDFYKWYLNTSNSFQNSQKIKTFVTPQLFAKAKKIQAVSDGDFYTNEVADVTVSPGTVKILSEKTKKNTSVIEVLLKSSNNYSDDPDIITEISLKITLIKVKGIWKINDIEGI